MSTLVLRHRFVATLVICLSGTALLPFVSLNTGSFGWQAFADAYVVFTNSFDYEDSMIGEAPWSSFYPPERMQFSPASDPERFSASYQIDQAIAQALTQEPTEILVGFAQARTPIFAVEARRTNAQYQIRAKAIEDDGASSYSAWSDLSDLSTPLEIEWTRALPTTRDGSLYLSQHGDLLAWIVDLDNDQAVAVEMGLREFAGQPLLRETLPPQ